MSDNYNDMARSLGYDPSDPDHVEKMQEDFAHDQLESTGLTEADCELLQSDEPTDKQLRDIEDE